MREIREFEEFLTEGVVKKQSKDMPRASFLFNEYADKVVVFLDSIYPKLKKMIL